MIQTTSSRFSWAKNHYRRYTYVAVKSDVCFKPDVWFWDSPLPHGVETPHLPEGERDVVRSLFLSLGVRLVGRLPVIETHIPLLLHLLLLQQQQQQ